MKSKTQNFFARVSMLALVAFLALPLTAFAQDRGRDRNRGNDDAWRQQEARRQQAERDRAAAILRQQEAERLRAEEVRHQQDSNWGRDRNYDRSRRGRNWDRYGSFGGSFQLRQTALNAGYNNGIQEGRKDRRRGDRFDYRDEGDYQKATEDFSSRLGDRELYKRYFREGFANGYEDGYRGY